MVSIIFVVEFIIRFSLVILYSLVMILFFPYSFFFPCGFAGLVGTILLWLLLIEVFLFDYLDRRDKSNG